MTLLPSGKLALPTPQNAQQAAKLLASLTGKQIAGYGQQSCPHPLDEAIAAACGIYVGADPPTREAMRAQITTASQTFTLLAFSRRMAAEALHRRSKSLIWLGLVAQVIEGFRLDRRENILVLAELNQSAQHIGADAKALFRRAAAMDPPSLGDGFAQFFD